MGHDQTRIARGDADHPRLLDPSVIDRSFASREPDPALLDWDAVDGGESESGPDQLIVGESEAAAAGCSVSRVSLGQAYPRPWLVMLGAGAWPPRVARTSVCPVCGGTDGADESGPTRGAYCGWCDRLGGVRSSGHPSVQAATQAAQSRARQVRPGARPFVPVLRHRGLIIVPDRYVPRQPRPRARPGEPPRSSRSSRPAPPGGAAQHGPPPDAALGATEGCA